MRIIWPRPRSPPLGTMWSHLMNFLLSNFSSVCWAYTQGGGGWDRATESGSGISVECETPGNKSWTCFNYSLLNVVLNSLMGISECRRLLWFAFLDHGQPRHSVLLLNYLILYNSPRYFNTPASRGGGGGKGEGGRPLTHSFQRVLFSQEYIEMKWLYSSSLV